MDKRHGWWLMSIVSTPLLFLARTGLLGAQAREESEVALEDWAAYGRVILPVLAVVAVIAILVSVYVLAT